MKPTLRIIGALWLVISGYFVATLVQGIYESPPGRLDTLGIQLGFVFLYLADGVASFFLLLGWRWARIAVSAVALLTVTASVLGLFAFFNSPPFSFVGIAFDLFALASAAILLFSRKSAVA